MSELSTYSLPALDAPGPRRTDHRPPTATDRDHARATVAVNLKITGAGAVGRRVARRSRCTRSIQLYGPGDVVGIDRRAIVRTDPRDWITNAEPNYLAHIEFYDEDLPWRYTPAAPSGDGLRLRPWIALVVLEEDEEFEDVAAHGVDRSPPSRC